VDSEGGSLPTQRAEFAHITSLTYDKVAQDYDDLWSPHVVGPNARLTAGLGLRRGDRVADLACGTGVYTLEMARLADPGEVVAVDYSAGMLAAARERMDEAGYPVSLVHARAEDFIARTPPASFDAVSLRFALAYIDWHEVLPHTARVLRPGGRVGVLTSVKTSVPQLYALFDRFRSSFEPVAKLYKHCGKDIGETWRLFRRLRETFAHGRFVESVPATAEQVAERLAAGGLLAADTWTETIRMWFDSGRAAVDWARGTGYSTHPSFENLGPHAIEFVENLFAVGLEGFREESGVPLDLVVGGVVARKA
jgi:ubiquinone/menaquinone biosynthesis C-methylase UbiE